MRSLDQLLSVSALSGPEARMLAVLRDQRVRLAEAWVLELSGADAEARAVLAAESLAAHFPVVRLLVLHPSRAAASRFDAVAQPHYEVTGAGTAAGVVASLFEVLHSPSVEASLGGSAGAARLRLVGCDAAPLGRAASVDLFQGDPDLLVVSARGGAAAPFRVDRRTGRLAQPGEGLTRDQAEVVADLADRAQLSLGRPVEIAWVSQEGRPAIAQVRPVAFNPSFTHGTYRRVALVHADDGTVAPLAIDALARALRREDDTEPAVRRFYGRPYRRIDRMPLGASTGGASLSRAAARAARVAVDVAAPVAAMARFEGELSGRLDKLDAVAVEALSDEAAIAALHERLDLAAESLRLLDRGREASGAVLAALEAAVGALPGGCYAALAALRITRRRRRAHERLSRVAVRLGQSPSRDRLRGAERRKWDDLRLSLEDLRPLGLDVVPLAWGHDDATLQDALAALYVASDDARERARRDAVRRVLSTARSRSMGRTREALALSLTALLARVAEAKGVAAEGLAATLLRVRRVGVEIGRRLVEGAVLDAPDDALYLLSNELEEALHGEPGAYASRVRLRREDDLRWARFAAPRRIEGRG